MLDLEMNVLDLMTEFSGLIQAFMSGIMVIVWVIYLQLFVSGIRRQRNTEILIHLGGSRCSDARIFVSNLGLEPLYILDIILTVWTKDGQRETTIADRTELAKEDLHSPRNTSLQGPLNSGELVDIGSFDDILQRAQNNTFDALEARDIERAEVKVAAITAAISNIAAARRLFNIKYENDKYQVRPETLYAVQIRSLTERYRLKRQLENELTK